MSTATYTAVVGLDDAQGVHHAPGTTFVVNVDSSNPPVPVELDDRNNLNAGRMTLYSGGGTGPTPENTKTPLTYGTVDRKFYRSDTNAVVPSVALSADSADTGKAIDAYTGAPLVLPNAAQFFTTKPATGVSNSGNWNSLTTPGRFGVYGTDFPTNAPYPNANFVLDVVVFDNGFVQNAYDNAGPISRRVMYNGTWSPWSSVTASDQAARDAAAVAQSAADAALTNAASAANVAAAAIPKSQKGVTGGVASLGSDGKLRPEQRWVIGQDDLGFQTVPLADYQALVTRVQALESGGGTTSLSVTTVTSAPTSLPADSIAFGTINGVSRLFYATGSHVLVANEIPTTLPANTVCFVLDGNSSRLFYSTGAAVTEVSTVPTTLPANTIAFYKPVGADRATRFFGGTA